jgi:hypothetical protein
MVPLKKQPEIGIDYNWNFTDYKHNRKPVFIVLI